MKKSTGYRKGKKASKKAAKKPIKKAVKKAAKKAVKKAAIKPAYKKLQKKRIFESERRKKEMTLALMDLRVVDAHFVEGHKLSVKFSNGDVKTVDFSKFFQNTHAAYLNKYESPEHFKSFKIEQGNIVWGEDWDIIFPVYRLYKNNIS